MTEGVLRNFGVVIPVGNFQNDRKNIESILSRNEEYLIETILVLDNQRLADIEQLQNFININQFTNTKVVHGVWNNPGGARNFGITFCTRTWVSFWDSDDSQSVLNVEKAVYQLLQSDSDAGVTIFEISHKNSSKLEKLPRMKSDQESLFIRLLSNPGLWRIIFRRSTIANVKFAEFLSAEDQIFLLRFLQINPRVSQINSLTYTYVQGGRSQLTKSLSVYSNTIQAIDLGIKEIGFLNNNWKKLGRSLLLKLILSVILKGSFIERTLAIKQLKKLISKIGWIDLLRDLVFIVKSFLAHRSW
jgi:glycosyltransferase involved in cell wall biosynthesis